MVYRLAEAMTAPQPENRSPGLRAFQIAMIIIPTIAIVLRFWSRTLAFGKKPPRFWWDDWLALMALVSLSLQSRCVLEC